MRRNCVAWATLFAAVAVAIDADCFAQEIAFIDLTKVTAHRELRRPLPSKNTSGPHGGTQQFYACFDPTKNEATLRVLLLSLDRTHYQIGDEPVFEVTVENAGSAPFRIPFSPHQAELQPEDPAQKFAYYELGLTLWITAGRVWSANTGGTVTLYGADDHPGTMLMLNPGEWVRIIGKGRFALPADGNLEPVHLGAAIDHAYAQASLYRSETLVTATATATVNREVCLTEREERQGIPIALDLPK